ncbi:hypothetical protein SESBI_42917 [Sesbania bispinosa]|nr:hypothetical protein SESBI_42917 [Sesbania bispinosa]
MEDRQRSQRIMPRRLSFSLDDFLGAKGVRRNGSALETNNKRSQTILVEPEHPQPELNCYKTWKPAGVTGNDGDDTPLVVSASVLNSILAGQKGVHLVCKAKALFHRNMGILGDGILWKIFGRRRSPPHNGPGESKQKAGEGLVAFIKSYRDCALQCKETLPKADLVYGCIKNIEEGPIFLSLSGITTFAKIMRKVVDVADTMKRQGGREPRALRICCLMCAMLKRGKERRRSRVVAHLERQRLTIPMKCRLSLLSRLQICQLVEEWLKDGTLSHTTLDYWTIRRAFHKQVKLGKVLLPKEEREEELQKRPLPNHSVNAVIPSINKIRIEEVEEETYDEEKALAVGIVKTRGFHMLFAQLGMGEDAQREAAGAIIHVARKWGGHLGVVSAPLT